MSIKEQLKDALRPTFYKAMHPRILKLRDSTVCFMKQYKNKYIGKKCFIIGNGPSLKISDLERLNNEITFACNRIYVLFDKTNWRPTFYLCQDPTLVRSCRDEIKRIDKSIIKFIKPTGQRKYDIDGAIYFDNDYEYSFKRITPPFSDNIENTVYDGLSITYTALQIAAYMGFSRIYLLGVDCNYSKDNKFIDKNSYPDARMYDPKKVGMPPDMEYTFRAYEVANEYANNHCFKIYNATRGGMLEVFQRIELDEVL